MPTFPTRFAAPKAVFAKASARADLFGMDVSTVLNALLEAFANGKVDLPDNAPVVRVSPRPPSETLAMTRSARKDYLALIPYRDVIRSDESELPYWAAVRAGSAPYPSIRIRSAGGLPKGVAWHESRLDSTKINAALKTKKGAAMSMSGVLSALLFLYSEKRADVSVTAATAVPPPALKARAELRRMGHEKWKAYMGTLAPEQAEELWRRDEQPHINERALARFDRDERNFFSGRSKSEGSSSPDDIMLGK